MKYFIMKQKTNRFHTFLKFLFIGSLLSRVKKGRLLKFYYLMMDNFGATA